jgi:putative oxidoreductase
VIANRLAGLTESPDRGLTSWWPIALRAIVGYGFMAHGMAKLLRGPDIFAGLLQALGVPAPDVMAWATIVVELLGGAAVLLGAFVPLVSIPMAVVLLVAIFTVHIPYGFISIKLVAITPAGAQFGPPGYEVNLLYLACLAALILGGPGRLSIDCWIARRRHLDIRVPGRSAQSDAASRRSAFRACLTSVAIVAGLAVIALPNAHKIAAQAETAEKLRFKAIAFDYFALFNPDSVVADVERVFPGKGRDLTNLWRTRQFEYSWLRSITNSYVDFYAVTDHALVYAAEAMCIRIEL